MTRLKSGVADRLLKPRCIQHASHSQMGLSRGRKGELEYQMSSESVVISWRRLGAIQRPLGDTKTTH
jgi:hypothetical protein